MITEAPDGIHLRVRVAPRAGRSEVVGVRNGALLVRLAAAPVDGAANLALVELLSRQLGVPRRAVHLESGARARSKRLRVEGLSLEIARQRLPG